MSDDLLTYYNRELTYIRRLGEEFARANPDIASRLRLESAGGQDPYVERLLEGFAYINARTRKKLDDDFPELAEALIGVLYPHYIAPVPSMSLVQFELDQSQGSMVKGYNIPDRTSLEAETVDGDTCRFLTCGELKIYPLSVTAAKFGPATNAPRVPAFADAVATLTIDLATFSEDGPLHALELDHLRFFLAGEPTHANLVYELMLNNVLGVALVDTKGEQAPWILPPGSIQPAGFDLKEAALPHDPRSFRGYRLLAEYFALPDRFRMVELRNLFMPRMKAFGTQFRIVLYLNRTADELTHFIDEESFKLGVVPIVNLFPQRADPLQLTHTQVEYHIVPDVRRPQAMEIYSIDRVTAIDSAGDAHNVWPIYSLRHAADHNQRRAFWMSRRRPAYYRDGKLDTGTEIEISIVDLDLNTQHYEPWTLEIETTCTNRNLPRKLEFGPGKPQFNLEQSAPVKPVRCLTPPTPARRLSELPGSRWRLVSHLALNHLSLIGNDKAADALREMLTLYDFVGSADTSAKIDSLTEVRSKRRTARIVEDGQCGYVRGIEVTLSFDERRFADNGLFLFASVLERFLALHCSLNAFVSVIAESQQREGVVHAWPPRSGDRQLI